MRTHELKTWPEYFEAVYDGRKNFEVRKDDRDFHIGDRLRLQEYNPRTQTYTGREVTAKVGYCLVGGRFGIEPGYIVLGLIPVSANPPHLP